MARRPRDKFHIGIRLSLIRFEINRSVVDIINRRK